MKSYILENHTLLNGTSRLGKIRGCRHQGFRHKRQRFEQKKVQPTLKLERQKVHTRTPQVFTLLVM